MQHDVHIGLLASTEGTYKRMGLSTWSGVTHAVEEINADPAFDFHLVTHSYNPGGELEAYADGINQLISAGAQHIFGTTTSASRKEIIPDLERMGCLLWYPCPYEGFECSENVIYMGGCPNQNLIPLLRYAIAQFGAHAHLVGSNYVWGWESNRIARELVEVSNGQVLGEKYYRFGCTDFAGLIEQIVSDDTAFVLNNLVGESSYHFLRQLSDACGERGRTLPVLSCNFTESELPCIRGADHIRLLSCGAFFESVKPSFVHQQHMRHGEQAYSHYYACAYAAIHMFAQAYRRTGTDLPSAICETLYEQRSPTVLGELVLSARNNHVALPSYIAEAGRDGFTLLHSEPRSLTADPYLVQTDIAAFNELGAKPLQRGNLRIVK
ncbi:transporter substrate-binding domain-containing protein [Marinobacter nanhaiticus D15-8W]|uniref:Regulator n=1 Tax=Marinobacter nanhaiticus D15-8W TaxID=626887 RepID=N6WAL6_9GAMM|nr:transporter substrate-binding protein [Marinobacter nanhaiticus]ENO17264.1 regulator [Marinobacter nanhaiticus D15-8W]BES72131.1 transporter substrate-binding domain-containing protein [Marinobacter nanhaiticus D15-8W]